MALQTILPALAISALSATALAQTGSEVPDQPNPGPPDQIVIVPVEPPGTDLFRKLDTDGDGYVSKDEARENDISQNFDQFDTDHDGKISSREYHIFAMTPPGELPESVGTPGGGSGLLNEEEITQQFKSLDVNDDGVLDRSEADAETELLFGEADTNGDQSIDLDEYKNAHLAVGIAPSGGAEDDSPEPQRQMSY